jgi:hypothetical protein
MSIRPPHFRHPGWPLNGAGDGIRTRDPELGRLALYQLSYSRTGNAESGGEGRIRTSEGISRQIYSLLPLATREPLQANLPIGPSRWRESNSQPTDYKSVALPLSYIGAEFLYAKTPYLFCRMAQVNKRGGLGGLDLTLNAAFLIPGALGFNSQAACSWHREARTAV